MWFNIWQRSITLVYEKYSLVGHSIFFLIFLIFHCRCHKFCSESGYSYYGVQALDWCFCGNNVPLGKFKLVGDNACNLNPCPGDTSTKCGGAWRMHVYSISSGGTLPVCAPLEEIFVCYQWVKVCVGPGRTLFCRWRGCVGNFLLNFEVCTVKKSPASKACPDSVKKGRPFSNSTATADEPSPPHQISYSFTNCLFYSSKIM